MTFDFDKIRDDPRAAYVLGVVLGFALGYVIAKTPTKAPPWKRPLFEAPPPEIRYQTIEAPCSECAEKRRVEEAIGADVES